MKIKSSLKSIKKRDLNSKLVRRRGRVYVIVTCPFNTSHMFVPEEVRLEAGIIPGFVRMSIGIEDVEDLWSDIDQALRASQL